MIEFSSRIIKGGALLDDSRRFVEVWRPELPADANVARIVEGNLLGKHSRSRAADVVSHVLEPRLVRPGPQVIRTLRRLTDEPVAFREACYYEAARHDALLAAFAEEALFGWYEAGRSQLDPGEVEDWLASLGRAGRSRDWNAQVRRRVAIGLLTSARDFGVLAGDVHKHFATPRLSPVGFAYVAFREHEQGRSARALMESRVWRRWLLDEARVRDLFAEADRLGVLRYEQVGSALRVDWRIDALEEVARAYA